MYILFIFLYLHNKIVITQLHNRVINMTEFLLFGVLYHFQHCTGHIMMGSFVGRGNQYTELVKVLHLDNSIDNVSHVVQIYLLGLK